MVGTNNDSDASIEETEKQPKFLLCIFLDGFGIAANTEVNAVATAKMPNFFQYVREYPVTLLSGATKDPRRRYFALGCGQEDNSDNFVKGGPSLSETLSINGKRQLKIAASEQFLNLSYHFNGGKEAPFAGEEWLSVTSPGREESLKSLGKEIVQALTPALKEQTVDVIFASLPLAHEASARGDFAETVKSLQQIDKLLPKIVETVLNADGLVLITAPYGNAERTRDLAADWEDREPTANPVPFLIIGEEYEGKTIGLVDPIDGDLSLLAPAGTLADFAPTVLSLLHINRPNGMTGESLI
ncbi:MAG: hypothetical protein Q8Q67_04200 [bacterium]|nr:hypothetical protein [bacterium]